MSLRTQSMESLTYLIDLLRRCIDTFKQYITDDLNICAAYPSFMKDTRIRRDEIDNAVIEGNSLSQRRNNNYNDDENIADNAVSNIIKI